MEGIARERPPSATMLAPIKLTPMGIGISLAVQTVGTGPAPSFLQALSVAPWGDRACKPPMNPLEQSNRSSLRAKPEHGLQKLPTIALLTHVDPLQVCESWAIGGGVVNLPPRPTSVSCQVELSMESVLDISTPIAVEMELANSSSSTETALPDRLEPGGVVTALYSRRGGVLEGRLRIGGCAVSFHIEELRIGAPKLWRAGDARAPKNHIRTSDGEVRQKVVVLDDSSTPPLAAEVSLGSGWRATLRIRCREATPPELERHAATRALLKAEAGTNYTTLLAQIKRGRQRGVEAALLTRAAAKLKGMKAAIKAPPVDELRRKLSPKLCTRPESEAAAVEPSQACQLPGCTVGTPRKGAVFDLNHNGAEEAFEQLRRERGIPDDTPAGAWLFQAFAKAAIRAVADGGVWKAYGKFNLSAPSRNQSPHELRNYLVRIDQHDCAAGLDCLVGHVERVYNKKVAAVQINVHMDASSSHTNHRDVYGAEQKERVGANCTCNFSTAAATACFSLGSSRRALLRTETDKHSSRAKCCDGCAGAWRKPWLHSGTLLYFNTVFNDDHTHGIPAHDTAADGEAGPRISVALLCAEGPPPNALEAACALLPRRAKAKASQP